MVRLSLAALALAAASPAFAGYYQAAPVAAPAKGQLFTQHGLWTCGEGLCGAAKSNSRPAIVCEALVRKVGRLSEFRAADAPLPPQQLEKCNQAAK